MKLKQGDKSVIAFIILMAIIFYLAYLNRSGQLDDNLMVFGGIGVIVMMSLFT